jgi:hypothetical protein
MLELFDFCSSLTVTRILFASDLDSCKTIDFQLRQYANLNKGNQFYYIDVVNLRDRPIEDS